MACVDVYENGEWSRACITHACNGALVTTDDKRLVYAGEIDGVPAFKEEADGEHGDVRAAACTR